MIKEKKNITVYLACILLCLVLITTHMTSGLYSRYTASGSGVDSAKVISFGDLTLTETGDFLTDDYGNSTNTLRVIPGVDLTKQATVDFEGSESATYVFVTVTVGSGWATADKRSFSVGEGAMTWSVSDDWTYVPQSESNGTYAYYITLAPNTALIKDVITNGTIKVSASITESQLNNLVIPDITFQATAVQSNGFSNVTEAWNTVKAKEIN